MLDINIISLDGDITTINAREGITIKDLKEEYVRRRRDALLDAGLDLDAYNFKFIVGTRILDNDIKLNKLLEYVIEGQLNITSNQRLPLRADCFREINNLDSSYYNPIEMVQRLLAILRKNISKEGENPILASSDSEIVLAAVQKNGFALRGASEELRNDKAIVLAAVQERGAALEYASEELKANREIVLTTVKQNGFALYYASEELKANKEFILAAVEKNGSALYYASEDLKAHYDFMLVAVQQNVLALHYASQDLKANKEFMLEAVQQNGLALRYALEKSKNDRDIVLEAVQQNVLALQYASSELRNDSQILQIKKDIKFKAFTRTSNENRGVRASTSSGSSQAKPIRESQSPKYRRRAHTI